MCWLVGGGTLEGGVGEHHIMERLHRQSAKHWVATWNMVYRTYITVLPPRSNQALELPYKYTFIFLFYLALPVTAAGANEYLLGISCHGAVEVLLALYFESRWRLAALACW